LKIQVVGEIWGATQKKFRGGLNRATRKENKLVGGWGVLVGKKKKKAFNVARGENSFPGGPWGGGPP